MLPGRRLARVILKWALFSFLLIAMLNILSVRLSPAADVFAFVALVVVFLIQIRHSAPGAGRRPAREKALTLGVQFLLTYLPLFVFHAQWGALGGFLAGSLLLLLPPRPAWILFVAVGLSMLVPPLVDGMRIVDSIYLCESTLLTGLVVYGLSHLAETVQELHDARGELARLAVVRERLRFARDLHDLIGFGLSAITLKSELVHRLIPAHPERAVQEVDDILAISRQSLTDVRRVASGFRDMSLAQEATSAESVLSAADVAVRVEVATGEVSRQVENALAAVLREAVTNVLRHSKATRCEIRVTTDRELVTLSVVNDGVETGRRAPSDYGGSGLGNLALRLGEIGGGLDSGALPDGTFRVRAVAPAAAPEPDGGPAAG
ncbi:sensor histidine kinase [Streptomyces yaanensis]|uniref:Sensor histidine kinase n=1 Tax=Streptomyces yaanensis TaxID=1142239 RepID=A0ABV7SF24_9ACTN|nr:histidine kinase [Streptomyces sp. CGMCC 4.7035]WNB99355.1 histidine kinase [Streptomyces sp. CGMCC 4.7035]